MSGGASSSSPALTPPTPSFSGFWPEDGGGAGEFGENFFQLPEMGGDGGLNDIFLDENLGAAEQGGLASQGLGASRTDSVKNDPVAPYGGSSKGPLMIPDGIAPAGFADAAASRRGFLPPGLSMAATTQGVVTCGQVAQGLPPPPPPPSAAAPRAAAAAATLALAPPKPRVTRVRLPNMMPAVSSGGSSVDGAPSAVADLKPRSGSVDGGDELLSDDPTSHSGDDYAAHGEKRLRREYSADEKARANRDRNREHARNTRLRKKAYVEKLKQTVQQLGAERDKTERNRSVVANGLIEQNALRKQVLQTMFFYRSTGERSRDLWAAVLDESFTCIMPITPYRSFSPTEVVNNQRVVVGVDGFVQDVCSLKVLTDSIGRRRRRDRRVCVQYYAGPQDTIVVGDSVMCRWLMKTENAAQCGALCECYNHGMLKARFSPQHKLTHLEMVFDVMSFMQQLQRASGRDEFRVVPNTVHMAQGPSEEPRVITEAAPPYEIRFANEAFERLTGYAAGEVVGRTLAVLQGADTDAESIAHFLKEIELQRPASMDVFNYCRNGRRFLNYVRAYPLATDGRVSHYLAVMEDAGSGLDDLPSSVASGVIEVTAGGLFPGQH